MPGHLDGFGNISGDSEGGNNAEERAKFSFKVGEKVRKLRTMSAEEMKRFYTGRTGAELEEVAHHGTTQFGQYGLIDETFIADLRTEPAKINDLLQDLGETRDEVSIVARTADGKFTRMFVEKKDNGRYKEVSKGVNTGQTGEERERTHRQGDDLFILEKGVQSMAA